MRRIFFLLLMFAPQLMHATIDDDRQQIQQRIQPVGNVRVEEHQEATSTLIPLKSEKKTSEATNTPGQEIYEKHCIVCHRDGLAGAPKFRDDAAWAPRMAKSDINALISTALKGMNAMPPKGTCQECSDSDIKAAINYMVPQK